MSVKVDITGTGVGPSRYVLRRDPQTGPAQYVRVWYHGGGQGPGGSERQEGRIQPEPGCVDYFAEGTPHASPDGTLTTGWIRRDGPVPVGPGLTNETDILYTDTLLNLIRSAHPGLPIYAAGYSSGGAFWTHCVHFGALNLAGVKGWAVVKNTPVFDWLSGEPQIIDRELLVAGTVPPKMAYWYATGDTEASQDHAEGHTTFVEAAQIFGNGYPDEVSRRVSYACGRRRVRIDTEQDQHFMVAKENGGSHSSSWGCVGRLIHRFFIGSL